MNSVQGEIYREIRDVSLALDRLNRAALPPQVPPKTLPQQGDGQS